MKKYWFLYSIVILLFSCKKEGDTPVSIHTPILSGFELRDDVGDKYFVIGTPNIRLTDTGNPMNCTYSILIYPNPNYNPYQITTFHDQIYLQTYANNPVTNGKIWIEKGVIDPSLSMNSVNVAGANYIIASTATSLADSLNLTGAHNFIFGVNNLEPGYYKIFVQFNEVTLWDNLIININPS